MKNLKRITILLIAVVSINSCKKDSPEKDGISFTANSAKPFSVDVTFTNENGTIIFGFEHKDNLTTPYTYSRPTAVTGQKALFLVLTEEGTPISGELKMKGETFSPTTESVHATRHNNQSAKGWEYLIP